MIEGDERAAHRCCDGLTRRVCSRPECSPSAAGLADWMRLNARAESAGRSLHADMSVILIWQGGGQESP